MLAVSSLNLSPMVASLDNISDLLTEIEDYNREPLTGNDRLKQSYCHENRVFIYFPETQELMTFTEYIQRLTEWHDTLIDEELNRSSRYMN
jgi:hypothetical protein